MKINRNGKIFKTMKWIHGVAIRPGFFIKRSLRKVGLGGDYSRIRNYKGIHKGERCFIIATGPSLTVQDVKKLEDEYTFGMNSLCKIFPELGWETTYFGVQDFRVYKRIKKEICGLKKTKLFIGDTVKDRGTIETEWCRYGVNSLNHRYNMDKLTADFSEDCYREVFDGYSIAYSLMQIAVYMGFSEIYLLGSDCNYRNQENMHFIELGNTCAVETGDRIIYAYKKAKEYCDMHGVQVYNATRGGMLEVFPRVDLDKIL